MTLRTFTNPTTQTRHILRSNPEQKTLKVPDSFEFPATSYCGNANLMLRMGDLGTLDESIIDMDEHPEMCSACAKYAPILVEHNPIEVEP